MYKIIFFFAGAFLLSGGVSLQADDQWKLVWSDEFNGKNLDYSKWGVEVNAVSYTHLTLPTKRIV